MGESIYYVAGEIMDEIAIRVEKLSKRYRIGARQKQVDTLSESLKDLLISPFDYLLGTLRGPSEEEILWALKDVSFEVKKGEVVGIIGHNGAGKSTLLKILSRITEPTSGRAEIHGRVGSLLEVGTGFHPELTGRENIYMNGAILGMRKVEIDYKFDEIVDFAGVEKFIDTPVKRYSSGMYVRLAFAVAAHLEPEILLVDEVLAVGDAAFQRKCLGKMGDVAKEGRTVLFVSHNMETIQQLCSRCFLLDQGYLVMSGKSADVISTYLNKNIKDLKHQYRRLASVKTNEKAFLLEADILNADGLTCDSLRFGEPFTVRMLWCQNQKIVGISYSIRVYDERDRFLFAVNTIGSKLAIEDSGLHEVHCKIPDNVFVPGSYRVSIGAYIRPHTKVHIINDCLQLNVINVPFSDEKPFDVFGNPIVAIKAFWEQSRVLYNKVE